MLMNESWALVPRSVGLNSFLKTELLAPLLLYEVSEKRDDSVYRVTGPLKGSCFASENIAMKLRLDIANESGMEF